MHRIVLISSALLVTAVLLAPTGLGQRPDDRAGMIGVGSVTAPAADAASTSTRPDDRPGIRGPGALAAGPTTVLVASDGFDWGDAGVGLAGGVGVALVVGALLVAATHRRRVQSLA